MSNKPLYTKGERVTCKQGHLIGFISHDLFKYDPMLATDILGLNGEALHAPHVAMDNYRCSDDDK